MEDKHKTEDGLAISSNNLSLKYDSLFNKMEKLQHNTGIRPNALIVGKKEMEIILKSVGLPKTKVIEFMGMKVKYQLEDHEATPAII